jgi:hypothetical protein
VPARSDFAGQPAVQTGTVTISDREGIIIVQRRFVYAGATETYFYKDITDADSGATIHTGKDLKSKTRWDHDSLKVTTTDHGTVTTESDTLEADGGMMVSVVRPDRKPIPSSSIASRSIEQVAWRRSCVSRGARTIGKTEIERAVAEDSE